MKKTRKLLTVIITVIAVILLMSALSLSSSAAEVEKIEVESWSQLRDALMAHNNYDPVEIKLTRDISREFDDYEDFDYGLFAVAGDKTLDLNGRTITAEVTIGEENAQYLGGNHFPPLFSFYYASSSLTIKDTSAAGTGKVHYDASLVKAKNHIASPICDIFKVNYGSLTIDGGTYEVGHVRTDWTTAVYINGKLFTGNLRSQVYGTVFTVGSNANVTINGGTFSGRGGSLVLDRTTGSSYRGAVIRKTSNNNSSVVINGGEFKGLGGANIFDCGNYEKGINIKNGDFKTEGISNALIRYNGIDAGTIPKGLMCIDGEMLAEGVENKVIVNGGKTYMYTAGSKPSGFYGSSNDTKVGTFLEFETQTPAIPTDRVTSLIDNKKLGESYAFTYKTKTLPKWMTDAGYVITGELIVRDSANNIVAASSGRNLQFNLSSISTVGTYSVQVKFSFIMGGKVVSTSEHTFIVEIIVPCTHTYSVISNTATCTAAGTKTERCTKCGDEKITNVEALGHLSLASDWTYNSTHHWYYCRRCYTTLTIQAHSWISSTNRTCSACRYNDNCEWGNAMDTEYDENYHWWPCDTHGPDDPCPNNHQLERELHTVCTLENAGSLEHEPEIEYSCQNGYVCDGCGEYFGATGEHKWEQIPMREGGIRLATCTTDGYIKYRCYYNGKYDCKGNKITCSATKTVTVSKLGHSFDYNTPDSDTATCTADGVRSYSCTRSRCTAVVTKVSPKKCHSYSEWTVTTAPTCTKEGESTASCVYGCGHTEKMPLDALGHVFGTPETLQQPTCTSAGKNVAKCTFDGCNETQEEVLPALEHSMIKHDLVPATMSAEGTCEYYECELCHNTFLDPDGYQESPVIKIAKIKSVTLSSTKYVHDGKNKTPKVTVTDANGNKLVKNVDYKTSVASKRSGIGRYTVKVTFIGAYSGSKNVYFTILPGKPATVKSASQTTSSVKLSWSAVSGAAGYTVYRYSPSKKAYVKAGTTEGTSLTVSKLYAGTKYTFRVVAYGKTSGGKVYDSESYALLKTATKTKTPELTKVTASSTKGKAYVYHSNVSGETGYTVYYSTSKNSGFKKYANFKADTTRCDITGLTSGKTYYFKVRTYIKTDSGYVYSAWSAVKSVKVK